MYIDQAVGYVGREHLKWNKGHPIFNENPVYLAVNKKQPKAIKEFLLEVTSLLRFCLISNETCERKKNNKTFNSSKIKMR